MRVYDIAVVGGGASGLMAAVMALKLGASVALVERGARVGRKLLATGNGRCNLTNTQASPADYHGDLRLMEAAMAAFPPARVMEFFESMGLLCLETRGGRVFPLCDQAAAVLDALRFSVAELGGEALCNFEAKIIEKSDVFEIASADGQRVFSKCAILATGGPASPSLGGTDAGFALFRQMGHRVARPTPALTQLETKVEPIRALKGVKIDGKIALLADGAPAASAEGDILFAEYGLSGTAVMAISREAARALDAGRTVETSISALARPFEAVLALLSARQGAMPRRPLADFLTGTVHKRLAQTLLKAALAPAERDSPAAEKRGAPGERPVREDVAPSLFSPEAGSLTGAELRAIARLLTDFRLPVTGTRGFAAAQASAGGAVGSEFDPRTLMSRRVLRLFACGEALDVDGDCGGFNLQWAWASGLFAAQNAVSTLSGG